tara:strand:+ start:4653 stop:5102 length:450 start_codon:yes stop_codon:yes gene_type:complete
MTNPCPISAAASALFEARAQAGLAKYGVTLADAGHDAPALLKHLAEELADALVYVTALRAAMEWRKPYGDDPAPTDGTEFLGLLSNGWRVVMWPTSSVQRGDYYSSWGTGGTYRVPYEPSYPQREWGDDYTLRLIGWQPLPAPPRDPAP